MRFRLRHRAGWLEAINAPIIWSDEIVETRHGMTTECHTYETMYQMAIEFMSRFSGEVHPHVLHRWVSIEMLLAWTLLLRPSVFKRITFIWQATF